MKKFGNKFKFLLGLLLTFVLWLFLAPFLARILVVEKPLEKADAILILSGSSVFIERTHKAAELFKNGTAPKIFLTNDGLRGGWNVKEQRNPYFYEKARWELIAQGVPSEAIEVLPEVVESTWEEAVLLGKIARDLKLKKVLLVTSAYHTRRTLSAFETVLHKDNAEVEIGIISPPTGQETPPPFSWWLSAFGWKIVAGEYVKLFGYWLFY